MVEWGLDHGRGPFARLRSWSLTLPLFAPAAVGAAAGVSLFLPFRPRFSGRNAVDVVGDRRQFPRDYPLCDFNGRRCVAALPHPSGGAFRAENSGVPEVPPSEGSARRQTVDHGFETTAASGRAPGAGRPVRRRRRRVAAAERRGVAAQLAAQARAAPVAAAVAPARPDDESCASARHDRAGGFAEQSLRASPELPELREVFHVTTARRTARLTRVSLAEPQLGDGWGLRVGSPSLSD